MIIRCVLLILLCAINMTSLADDKKTLTFASNLRCPWNCSREKADGVALDIIRAIYEPLNYQIIYITIPWPRAMMVVNKGGIMGLIGADKFTPELKDFIFPTTAISSFHYAYAVTVDSKFEYKDIDSLKNQTIGVNAYYHFNGELGKYIDQNYNNHKLIELTYGYDAVIQNIRKLANKRIDLYIDDPYVILNTAKSNGLADKIKIGGYFPDLASTYVAFSPARAESVNLAKLYDEGVAKLKQNGTYQKILQKYGISEEE